MEHFCQNVEGWFYDPTLYVEAIRLYNNAKFVEVGCWKGKSVAFAGVEIINSGKNIILDVVDTFKGSDEHKDLDTSNLYNEFLKNIEPVKSVIGNVHQMTSVEASKLYEDNSLDFVYIDAAHDYESVKQDLIAWYPKVKKGGLFGGDDYSGGWPEVNKAVDEFFVPQKVSICGQAYWAFLKL